jgi:hypothetical protein
VTIVQDLTDETTDNGVITLHKGESWPRWVSHDFDEVATKGGHIMQNATFNVVFRNWALRPPLGFNGGRRNAPPGARG